jgi:hypothetical protein
MLTLHCLEVGFLNDWFARRLRITLICTEQAISGAVRFGWVMT